MTLKQVKFTYKDLLILHERDFDVLVKFIFDPNEF